MFRSLKFVAIALVTLFVAEPAVAQFKPNVRVYLKKIVPPVVRPPLRLLRLPISPSEAKAIVQDYYPDFRVLKVLQKGEYYYVTVADDNSVMRVVVSGLDGSMVN